jgi:putative Mn2+ efflux pump MntP
MTKNVFPMRAVLTSVAAAALGTFLAFALRGSDSPAHPVWELGVPVVIGLDVLISGLALSAQRRSAASATKIESLAVAVQFASLLLGSLIGAGARVAFGGAMVYIGLVLLALFGIELVRESFAGEEPKVLPQQLGWRDIVALGSDFIILGVALPALGIPFPLLFTILLIAMISCAVVSLVTGPRFTVQQRNVLAAIAGALFTAMSVGFILERLF